MEDTKLEIVEGRLLTEVRQNGRTIAKFYGNSDYGLDNGKSEAELYVSKKREIQDMINKALERSKKNESSKKEKRGIVSKMFVRHG